MYRLIACLCLAGLMAQEASANGVYSAYQANRGKGIYTRECSRCHGGLLNDGTAPPLTGPVFQREWRGKSLNAFFLTMRATMTGLGVSLPDQGFVDVIAYILEYNRYPPGKEDLLADSTMLAATSILPQKSPVPAKPPAFVRGGYNIVPHSASPMTWELEEAPEDTANWLFPGHNYTGDRRISLSHINHENAPRLQITNTAPLEGNNGYRTHPIIYDGVLYVTTSHTTVAMDATSLESIWHHEWNALGDEKDLIHHGVALKGGRVMRVTPDGYLIALKMEDGGLLWARRIVAPTMDETITAVPMPFRSLILIRGHSGRQDNPTWMGGFKIKNGEPVWRFDGHMDDGVADRAPESMVFRRSPGSFQLDITRGELYLQLSSPDTDRPMMTVLDPRKGTLKWRWQAPVLSHPPLTSTTGGLTFMADGAGDFIVHDTETGNPFYRFGTDTPVQPDVITYGIGGKQYVATISGAGSLATIRLFTIVD